MKKIEDEAKEHNRRVKEHKQLRRIETVEDAKLLRIYTKGLPDDLDVLMTRGKIHLRSAKVDLWEFGRIMIKVWLIVGQGNFKATLEAYGIPRSTAYKAINVVRNIPDAELKALSRNPSHDYEIPGPMTEEEEELGERIESKDFTVHDLARRSPVDVKKYLARIETLEAENKKLEEERNSLQVQMDVMKLGTIEEQKIREWISKWQLDWLGGRNRVLTLLKDVAESAQMDVFAVLQWFGRELVLLEMELARRYPDFDQWSEADRAALGLWLERMRSVSPLERVEASAGCEHFMRLPEHLGGGPLKENVCSHVQGDCEEKECCRNCGAERCASRCAYAPGPTDRKVERNLELVGNMGGNKKKKTAKRKS